MRLDRELLLGLIAVLLLLSVAFVLPFLEYFLLAVILAYVLSPVQEMLERRTTERVAASLIVLGAAVALVLPLVIVARSTAAEAVNLLQAIQAGDVTLAGVEAEIYEFTGVQVDVSETVRGAVSDVQFDSVVGIFGAVTHVLIGVGLTLFLLYYFLKDGEKFAAWLKRTLPLDDDVQDQLYEEIDDILWAVLVGHVFVAIVQGLIAGFGLAVTGVPNATFWTVVMIVLALLPIVGSFLVWGPAAGYLAIQGEAGLAVALFVYGTIVVGISDDYLRPIVVDRYAELNPSVIILGVLGGIYVIGFMGIFFGPVIIGALKATLDVYRREHGQLRIE